MSEWLSINPRAYDPLFDALTLAWEYEEQPYDSVVDEAIALASEANNHDLRWVARIYRDGYCEGFVGQVGSQFTAWNSRPEAENYAENYAVFDEEDCRLEIEPIWLEGTD